MWTILFSSPCYFNQALTSPDTLTAKVQYAKNISVKGVHALNTAKHRSNLSKEANSFGTMWQYRAKKQTIL
ncbi:hypothetical protein BDV41DRAFT_303062 [Aspergillus transmontanensis]|uniref:Uncharacterized protein n=1 Tax=Aspergillus transmontanensis TaxID=1034304 RepID=A0A5N6VVS5_9EURO|nr:hypothetical protein BDV41DRAFT_303062 [Aspergillus transmontanensis]